MLLNADIFISYLFEDGSFGDSSHNFTGVSSEEVHSSYTSFDLGFH